MSNHYYRNLYSSDELAEMWCRLNEGKHPTTNGWNFNEVNIAGAMALINVLIGPSKCIAAWRHRKMEETNVIERRRFPRDEEKNDIRT